MKEILKKHGFEIKKDETEVIIEEIKMVLINKIENQDSTKLSSFLVKTFIKSYSALCKLFNKSEGMTIVKYEIKLIIDQVNELIQFRRLNFSKIAYSLDYNNSGQLARPFKMSQVYQRQSLKTLKSGIGNR